MILTGIGILGLAACVCLAGIAAVSRKENRMLTVTEYHIQDGRIRKPCTFVMLADLHNAEFGTENEELIGRIISLRPDAVLIAGDVIIGRAGAGTETAVHFLNTLGARVPVYISKGNHEMRACCYPERYGTMWEELYERTKENVHWLINSKAELPESKIMIAGLDMDASFYRRFRLQRMEPSYLAETLPASASGEFTVLLAHNPDYFPAYADWGADLTLSGHVHGGMIILPGLGGVVSPMVRLFPRYYRGLYRHHGKRMILTGGLGGHTLRIRVNNKPELCLIRLSGEEQRQHE